MQIKKIAQIILVSCSVLALSACSTTGRHHGGAGAGGDSASVSDANGAMASGAGQGESFSSEVASGSQDMLHKRTYYFDFDRSDVHEEDKPAIYANADYLMSHPNACVTVEGHTDPRGSREYNVALAERRANAVAELLKSKGVNPNQIRVVSYGAERLAVPGHSEEDFQQDRRAIIVYRK